MIMFNGRMTPAEGPVDVNRYTLYAMIPGLDTYVASKLDKKKFVAIYSTIFMIGILTFTILVMYNISIDPELTSDIVKTEKADMVYQKFMPQILTIILGTALIHFPIYTYLVRKWAKKWNKKFEN